MIDRDEKSTAGDVDKEASVTVESNTDTVDTPAAEITESGEEELSAPAETDLADDLVETDAEAADLTQPKTERKIDWSRVVAFGVLPALVLLLAAAAAFLYWQDQSARRSETARNESVQVAKDSTIRMLSYKPDTVEQDLASARDLLTGTFRDSYTQLTNDVVIPGAKQKGISAVANVPAVASVSADPAHAVALVFVNQTVIIGDSPPTSTNSSVKVTLDKVGDRWLISAFDPI